MSDTIQARALNEVRFGDAKGKLRIVPAGSVFQCPAKDFDFFLAAGAVKRDDSAAPGKTPKTPKAEKTPAAPDPEREALEEEAKGLGISVRRNMKTETLREKIAEAKGGDDDGGVL